MSATCQVLEDPSRRALDGDRPRPVRIHRWRADRTAAPLVVLSHGTGGAAEDLAWWAEALRAEGFDVLAPDHHGNTHVEPYRAEGFAWWWERPLDLSFALDRVPARGPVGAAGFSLGGYSAAALCGARVGADAYRALLRSAEDIPSPPEYPGLREVLRSRYGGEAAEAWTARAAADLRDPRVRAGFLLCPALGPAIDPASLAAIDIPVAVRWTRADTETPPETHGELYTRSIPGADGAVVGGPEAGHYGFVIPDQADERARGEVIEASVRFFRSTLG